MKGAIYRLRVATNFLTESTVYTIPKGRLVVQLEHFDGSFAPFLVSKGVVAFLFCQFPFVFDQDFELIGIYEDD